MNDQERLAEYANEIRNNLSEITGILNEKEYLEKRVENLEKENAIVSIHLRDAQIKNKVYADAINQIYNVGLWISGTREYSSRGHKNCIRIAKDIKIGIGTDSND